MKSAAHLAKHNPPRVRTALLCLQVFVLSFHAQGLVLRVTDTQDSTNRNSLRGAVIEANRLGGANLIILEPGTHRLSIAGQDEGASYTGDLDVVKGQLTIIGSGSGAVISAVGLDDRVFHIWPGGRLVLSRLIISGGGAPQADPNAWTNARAAAGESGGCIYNEGHLSLRNCIITGNSAGLGIQFGNGGNGGAIHNTGIARLHACIITNNIAGHSFGLGNGGTGGAIYNSGELTASQCLINGNSSGDAAFTFNAEGNGGPGGGVYNGGTMKLTHCTITANFCGNGGSGLVFPGGRNPWGLPWPTPGGRGGEGGAICNTAELLLKYCEISANASGDGGPGSIGGNGGNGGGICNFGTATIHKSILLGNLSGNGWDGAVGSTDAVGGSGGSGGALWNSGSSSLIGCIVRMNKAGNGGSGGPTFVTGAPGKPGGPGGDGGGIFNATSAQSVQTSNTKVAGNFVGIGGLGGAGGPAGYLPGPDPGGLGGTYVPAGLLGTQGPNGSGPDFFGDLNFKDVSGEDRGALGIFRRISIE